MKYKKFHIRVASQVQFTKLGRDIRWRHKNIRWCLTQTKQKQISKFSSTLELHSISLLCSKYFLRDWKEIADMEDKSFQPYQVRIQTSKHTKITKKKKDNRKSKYQSFLVLSNFTRFLYFVLNIFSVIGRKLQTWKIRASSHIKCVSRHLSIPR